MKKVLLILLVALLSHTANAKIWLVDNNSTYLIPNAQAAHDSANAVGGDTIMVIGSAASYLNLVITKPIVLIGDGMNNIYGQNTTFSTIEIYSSDVHISGVISSFILQCSYAAGDSLGNVIIERCMIQGSLGFYGNPCVLPVNCTGPYAMLYDTYIRNNVIEGTIYLHTWNTQGAKLIYDTLVFENNIITSGFVRYHYAANLIGCETIMIRNNNFIDGPTSVFIGSGNGITPLNDVVVSDNIFYASNPQGCDSCNFFNNLTFGNGANDTITSTGIVSGNIIANATDTIFQNYNGGAFSFNQDFNLAPNSPADSAGTNGTHIGTFGGDYPLNVGDGARIPVVENISLTNVAEPQAEQFFLDLTARARRNFSDTEILQEIKYSFDTIYPFGQGTPLSISSGLNVSFMDSILPATLDSGLHTITFIARDSKGSYSIPRTYPFNVCTYNEVVADFNLYQSGRDIILDANYKNVLNTLWDFGDGQTSNLILSPLVHHFDSAANYNVKLVVSNPCFSDSTTKSVFIKGINTISPTVGGNIGAVTMTITGAGFSDSANVKLVQLGQQDRTPFDSSTTITNGTVIQTIFDLSGAALGLWDVVVENPDTTFITIGGFQIDSMIPIITATQILGSNFMRLNTWQDYTIMVENKSNVDAVAIPVWFAVPTYMDVKINFSYDSPDDNSILWDTVPIFIEMDTLFDQYLNYKMYGFTLINVPASGVSDIIKIKLKRTTFQPMQIISWTNAPYLYTDSLQQQRGASTSTGCSPGPVPCIICAASAIPGIGGCAASINSVIFDFACNIAGSESHTPKSTIQNIFLGALSCSASALILSNPLFLGIIAGATSVATLATCLEPCFPPPAMGDKNIFPITAVDPNEKYGSTGALNSPYLNSQSPINYSIHFENVDTATAPAQTVIVIDTLDKTKLDLSTFQLTSIGFGDTSISIPNGRKSFTTNIDMQPALPIIAELTTYLNDSTGILTTICRSLDPLTLEPTDSTQLGFLLPNDSTGRGEGFVSFSVKAQSSVQSGDTINNRADIFFDENAPIATPTWTNIIDNLKPQGQVISATQISSTDSINVIWASIDNGPAAIYVHNVYYNVNGGEWLLWKYNTSLTSDVFVGIMDSTYGFYSVAIDSAYNIEDTPLAADDSTTLTVDIEEINQSQMIVKLFPNPANSTLNVFINRFDKSKNDFNIIARDITGRTVRNEKVNITSETKTVQLDISQFVSGIYFFEVTDGAHRTFKKLIKN